MRSAADLQARINYLESELEREKEQNSHLHQTIRDLRDEIRVLQTSNDSLKDQYDKAALKLKDLTAEIDRLSRYIDKKASDSESCMEKTLQENI